MTTSDMETQHNTQDVNVEDIFRPIILVFRLFGLLPLSYNRKTREHYFSLASFPVAYSGAVIVQQAFHLARYIYIFVILDSVVDSDYLIITGFIMTAQTALSLFAIMSIKSACRIPELLKYWKSISAFEQSNRKKMRVSVSALAGATVALVVLSTGIYVSFGLMPSSVVRIGPSNFIFYPSVQYITELDLQNTTRTIHVAMAATHIFSIAAGLMPFIFFCLCCRLLGKELQLRNQQLEADIKHKMYRVRHWRKKHMDVCKLVHCLDDIFCWYLLVTYMFVLLGVMFSFYFLIFSLRYSDADIFLKIISAVFGVGLMTFFFAVTSQASAVHHQVWSVFICNGLRYARII